MEVQVNNIGLRVKMIFRIGPLASASRNCCEQEKERRKIVSNPSPIQRKFSALHCLPSAQRSSIIHVHGTVIDKKYTSENDYHYQTTHLTILMHYSYTLLNAIERIHIHASNCVHFTALLRRMVSKNRSVMNMRAASSHYVNH